MKAKYDSIFAKHVAQAIAKAQGLGIKASWPTEKHLDALAEATAACDSAEEIRDCLGECYNVSAYQQMLARKFEKLGHFQRDTRKPISEATDDFVARILAQVPPQ